MKRIIGMIAALAAVLSLSACASALTESSTETTVSTTTAASTTTTEAAKPAPAEKKTEALPVISVKPGSESVKGCTLVMQNNTDTAWSYGSDFRLLNADTWQAVPFRENVAFDGMAYGLNCGKTAEETLDFEAYLAEVPAGDYLLEKTFQITEPKISYELTVRIPLKLAE